jgi:hypothetical protein
MPQQESLLREGIAAMKAGNKRDGRQLLMTVVEQDPSSEEAWLWLAATASNPRDSLACLKRVLAINPQNTKAAAGLRAVTAQLEQAHRTAEPASAASPQIKPAVTEGAVVPPAQINDPTLVANSAIQTPLAEEPVLQPTAPILKAAQQPSGALSKRQGRFFPNLVVVILALLLILGLVIIAALAYTGWR